MASNYSVPASTRQLLPLDPTRPVPSVIMSCEDVDDDSGDVTAADTDEDEWLCSVFTVVTWLWLYDEFVLPKDLPLRRNITDSVIRDLHVLILFIYSQLSSSPLNQRLLSMHPPGQEATSKGPASSCAQMTKYVVV